MAEGTIYSSGLYVNQHFLGSLWSLLEGQGCLPTVSQNPALASSHCGPAL